MSSPIKQNPFPPVIQPPSVAVSGSLQGVTVTHFPPGTNNSYAATLGPAIAAGQYSNQNTTYYASMHRGGYKQVGVHHRTDCVIL